MHIRTATRPSPSTAAKAKAAASRLSPEAKLAQLKHMLREVNDLEAIGALMTWDHATFMPPGGASARVRQTAMLTRLSHEKSTAPALGKLLDALMPYAETLADDAEDARLIRVARRDFEKATKLPADYIERAAIAGSTAYEAWTHARPANDFAAMQPHLETALELSREYASFFAPYMHIADPLIDNADEGFTVETVRQLFGDLRRELVPLVRAICAHAEADDNCLRGHFPEHDQIRFGLDVVKDFGYDTARGRLDKSPHPFCTKFALGDVRITTRVYANDIGQALFSTLHEAGHALYEQGVDPAFESTPLGSGVSAGVHESQSRLWENVVGRSRDFWAHYFPKLQQTFPVALAGISLDAFYLAINKVKCSLIRTDADEVTYNLHVMMRFDLEIELLEGRLRVKDIPEAWRNRMQADLGAVPEDDRDGCLQDVHWYCGSIGGAFQGYTIGNILSVQFFDAAAKALPEMPAHIRSGDFTALHAWLRDNLYRHGRLYTPDEVIRRATGRSIDPEPYLTYLRTKYGELYPLPPRFHAR